MTPVMGGGSSCTGDAWRALAEPPWTLALDPDPAVCKGETSSVISCMSEHGLFWKPWKGTEPGTHRSSKASIPAVPQEPPLQLSLSLLPAPAADGHGHGRAAARASGGHAGIVLSVGSHGALGQGVTACQCPALLTGHCHLTGSRSHHPWVSTGMPVPDGPTAQGDVAAVTRPITAGDSSEGWVGTATPKSHQGGRGTCRHNSRAEEHGPSLPCPRVPGLCAPAAGTRGWHWGSTGRVPPPLSCWHSGWAPSPAPPRACHQCPAPWMGSGNCTLPGGEGYGHRAAMAASQRTQWCQGCPQRALSLPPSMHTAHAPLPCHPSNHTLPFTQIPEHFW